MSPRICFLHIGTHKTGTTSIQRLLALNASKLLAMGVHVPSTGRPPGSDGHHNIAWQLNSDPRFDATNGTLQSLSDEVERVGAPNACLSSEGFEYLHAKPETLQSMLATFSSIHYLTKIIVYLRPHDDYVRSLYAELLKHGITETAEEFHRVLTRDRAFRCRENWIFQFDYDRLLAPFRKAFGDDNVLVRPYPSGRPDTFLIEDFLSLVLPIPSVFNDLELPARLNASQDT